MTGKEIMIGMRNHTPSVISSTKVALDTSVSLPHFSPIVIRDYRYEKMYCAYQYINMMGHLEIVAWSY
jgi:hypothetical protein